MDPLLPFTKQPLQGSQVAPQSSRKKLRLVWTIQKVPPAGRQESAFVVTLLRCRHLPRHLVGREKVVCVQPLNIVALAKREGSIPGRRSTLIFLRNDGHTFGSKLLRHSKRLISRPIINHYDLCPRPSLGERGSNRISKPRLGVVRRNQNRN